MLQVKVVRAGTTDEVPLKGLVQVTYKPDATCCKSEGDAVARLSRNVVGPQDPNLRVHQEDLRLTFLPERHGADALYPGDQVIVRLMIDGVYESTPSVPLAVWFPQQPFRFQIPTSKRVYGLSVSFVGQPATANVVFALDRSSKETLDELKTAISLAGRVSLDTIATIKCGDVTLTDRFDVAALKNYDALTVTLRNPPPVAVAVPVLAPVVLEAPAQRIRPGKRERDIKASSDDDNDDDNDNAPSKKKKRTSKRVAARKGKKMPHRA
jgi:hypothetical protein